MPFKQAEIKSGFRSVYIILLVALAAVLVLPLYMIYVLTPAFSEFIIDDTEQRLVGVAERMAESIRSKGTISKSSITPEFVAEVEYIRKTMGMPKVKIFTVQGVIVYSTDPSDIGHKTRHHFFPEIVDNGHTRSVLVTKEKTTGINTKYMSQMLETYVPIFDLNTFNVVGVFEVYYDVTSTNTALDHLIRHAYFVISSIALVLLGAVLLSVMRARSNLHKRALAEQEILRQKELLEQQNNVLVELHEEAQALSLKDHLTGLGNRRLLDIHLERAFALAQRYGKDLTIVMLDVDHFKAYNDSKGHQAGDLALVNLAHVIRKHLRETDLAFRYGGEEFLLLLSEIDLQAGQQVAEKLRCAVAHETDVTISLGVTAYRPDATIAGMIKEADEMLYRAKVLGRNQVVVVGSEPQLQAVK